MYDILLTGGHVIDSARNISEELDVGIANGKIECIGKRIDPTTSRITIPVDGKFVVPGLIDMHCHPNKIATAAFPDQFGIYSGVTAICEGGQSGAGTFLKDRKLSYENTVTDLFCFLNLAITGLSGIPRPEIKDEHDIDIEWSRRIIEENRDFIKGIKLRALSSVAKGLGLRAVEMAKQLANTVQLPLIIHIGDENSKERDLLDSFSRSLVGMLESGDVLTHYLTPHAGSLISFDGEISSELLDAKKRGVVLDACHGSTHLSFQLARLAFTEGILPTVISTDLSRFSLGSVQSLLVTMSKFINLGLTIEQVVEMATLSPAKVLHEVDRRGQLMPGFRADLTIIEKTEGNFVFTDGNSDSHLRGNILLEPRGVIKDGKQFPYQSRYRLPTLN